MTDGFVKGLAGVVAAQSSLSSIDGTNGVLTYRGIDIHDLAEATQFEEVAHLLWHGSLPNRQQLDAFNKELAAERALPPQTIDLLRAAPHDAVPMEVLRTAVSALAFYDPESEDISPEATQRKGVRLTAKFPAIVAAFHRLRQGQEPVSPDTSISHAANFLYMLSGETPDELHIKALNLYLVLLADHSLNASTFTARVVSSTNADLHSAITAALGALKGNLHGGAAEATMRMLLAIGSMDKVDSYVDAAFGEHRKIMGFGHRIYKTGDPRARHLQTMARTMEQAAGKGQHYVDMAIAVENAVQRHRELYPNVDYFSAPTLYYTGIPVDLDTCVFAMSRVAGWTAHVLEQYADATLIRPKGEYIGPKNVKFVPLDQR
jgi:2-methylcitrate synthase